MARGETVAILVDQNVLAREAVFVPFFGRPAATTPALALFQLKTDAAVVPVFTWPEGGGRYRLEFETPILAEEFRHLPREDGGPRRDGALHAGDRGGGAQGSGGLALDARSVENAADADAGAGGGRREAEAEAEAGESVKRLVVGTNWIGDAVMSLPFLRALRAAHPGDPLSVFAPTRPRRRSTAPSGTADEVLVRSFFLRDVAALASATVRRGLAAAQLVPGGSSMRGPRGRSAQDRLRDRRAGRAADRSHAGAGRRRASASRLRRAPRGARHPAGPGSAPASAARGGAAAGGQGPPRRRPHACHRSARPAVARERQGRRPSAGGPGDSRPSATSSPRGASPARSSPARTRRPSASPSRARRRRRFRSSGADLDPVGLAARAGARAPARLERLRPDASRRGRRHAGRGLLRADRSRPHGPDGRARRVLDRYVFCSPCFPLEVPVRARVHEGDYGRRWRWRRARDAGVRSCVDSVKARSGRMCLRLRRRLRQT